MNGEGGGEWEEEDGDLLASEEHRLSSSGLTSSSSVPEARRTRGRLPFFNRGATGRRWGNRASGGLDAAQVIESFCCCPWNPLTSNEELMKNSEGRSVE
jgi:hypothetical protein